MQLFKKTVEGFLFAGIFFLFFLLFFENSVRVPAWLQMVGRMHPMIVHFPITLLLIYFVLLWIPQKEPLSSWIYVLGYVAAASAVITAIMGLLLSFQETHEGLEFKQHKWGGVAIAVIAFLFCYLHSFFISKKWIGRGFTIVSSILVLFTGHWGGNLTHGEGYLLEPFAKEKRNVPFNQALAFNDVVKPIFQTKCGTCHSNGNSKGGLSLSDTAGVLKGGKTADFLISGDPEKSLFIQRILLPSTDKKHMAPASKPQLTDEEFQLLFAWVKAGAPMNRKVIDLLPQDSFRLLASRILTPSETSGEETVYSFPAADEKLIGSLNNNYRVVTPLDNRSPALDVQFYGSSVYSSKSLEELLAVKKQIINLGLAKMPVSDNELKVIEQMVNLEKLNLNYTDITNKGIPYLSGLKNLKEITLSGTAISASALEQLLKLPSLHAVFVWNTPVDSNSIESLRAKYKNVNIETGYVDNGEDILPLNPPVAHTIPGVYDPGVEIRLVHPLRGVEIRYTLDGTEPDSIKSPVYKEPLKLHAFTVIKAKAYKPKWYGSKSLKAVYFMKGLNPDSVAVVSEQTNNGGKGKMLFDRETGDLNGGSDKWMDFQKQTTCCLFFNDPVSVHKLMMNMLVYRYDKLLPDKIEVWGGMDAGSMKLLTTWKTKLPPEDTEADILQPVLEFPQTTLKYLRLVIHPWVIKDRIPRCFISEVVVQ